MANIKSQKKRIKTAEKARQRNKAVRSELKTAVKRVQAAAEQGDAELAKTEAAKASRLLDKAASKGIIHKNQAAQRKSGVAKLANSVAAKPAAKAEEKAEKKPAAKKTAAKKPAAKTTKTAAKKPAAKKTAAKAEKDAE